ncbi:MAG: hypothetical protein ACE1ZM_08875 [Gammaproteobacteria bacterium]
MPLPDMGFDRGGITLADTVITATNKVSSIDLLHFTITEENVAVLNVNSVTGASQIDIGGGDGTKNAVETIKFFAAANDVTLTGAEFMEMDGPNDVVHITKDTGIGFDVAETVLHVFSTASVPKFEFETASSTGKQLGLRLLTKTTNATMGDAFGPTIDGFIEDTAGVENKLGRVAFERDGADNEGRVEIYAGTDGEERVVAFNANIEGVFDGDVKILDDNNLQLGSAAGGDYTLSFISATDKVRLTGNSETFGILEVIGGTGNETNTGIVSSSSSANATNKQPRFRCLHFLNAEEDILMMGGIMTSSLNTVSLGGNSSSHNAATSVNTYTAANNTTTAGTQRLQVKSSGAVEVNNLGTNADVQTNGAGEFITVSSELTKTIHGFADYGLTAILGINPILFNYLDDPKGCPQTIGFSAENVQEFIPHAVSQSSRHGVTLGLSLKSQGITAALVKAVQQLNTMIEALQ